MLRQSQRKAAVGFGVGVELHDLCDCGGGVLQIRPVLGEQAAHLLLPRLAVGDAEAEVAAARLVVVGGGHERVGAGRLGQARKLRLGRGGGLTGGGGL